MHKTRLFRLGGREKNGRVRGGDEMIGIHSQPSGLRLFGFRDHLLRHILRIAFILKVASFFFFVAVAYA
jgi:hypothetical protein